MTRRRRVAAATRAGWRTFLRRRTAMFFTFFFPVIIILIFGVLVRTEPAGGGLFAAPPGYYVAGYLAVVVLFTPISRVGGEVARHREGNRFEKLATTPLSRWEWLLAQVLVNAAVVALAAVLILALVVALTDPAFAPSLLLVPYLLAGVAVFAGLGAVLGRLADSQDGVVAASNAVALPLLFLSDTFLLPSSLPAWFTPLLYLSPLTYFARGVRAATYRPEGTLGTWQGPAAGPLTGDPLANLVVLSVLAVAFFIAGAYAIPRTN